MRRVGRTAGLWGPAAFTAAALVAARRQPGYRHRSMHVSGLAAKGERSATVMVPGFLALGAANLVMPTTDPVVDRLARAAGVTAALAGLVPASQPRCPTPFRDAEATPSDVGHAVASIATFGLWSAMPVVAVRHAAPGWYRCVSGVLAVTNVVGLVVAAATTNVESEQRGLAQRAFLGSVFAWHVATAIAVRGSDGDGRWHG